MTAIFHGCGCGHPPVTLNDLVRGQTVERGTSARVIDLHAHVLTPEVDAIIAADPRWQSIVSAQANALGAASVSHNGPLFAGLAPRMTQAELRIADMMAMCVDVQVISPSPTQYYYWADEALSERLVAMQNDSIVTLCAANPDHFLGFAAVSLQYPELAARQLRQMMGHPAIKGVEISSMAGSMELTDPSLEIFWATAEELGAVVFLHPLGTTLGTRLQSHYLSNVIGQPLETTIALSGLILSGLLDRYPALQLLGAHGGGYLPAYIGRSDHAWHVRPEAHVCASLPSSYLRQLWFDTLVYDPPALRRLADQVGVDRLVVGTDYPYDMGAYSPHALVQGSLFDPEERTAILARNAARLLGTRRI